MNSKLKYLSILLLILLGSAANAEIAVIVHPSNGSALDSSSISKIYLAKLKSFPGGGEAVPVNQAEGSSTRTAFDEKVLGKSPSQLKAYWSKLVFTGKGSPPRDVADDAAVKALISSNPNMVGYIDAGSVDDSVKVVATF